jgi:hypothetical protein
MTRMAEGATLIPGVAAYKQLNLVHRRKTAMHAPPIETFGLTPTYDPSPAPPFGRLPPNAARPPFIRRRTARGLKRGLFPALSWRGLLTCCARVPSSRVSGPSFPLLITRPYSATSAARVVSIPTTSRGTRVPLRAACFPQAACSPMSGTNVPPLTRLALVSQVGPAQGDDMSRIPHPCTAGLQQSALRPIPG